MSLETRPPEILSFGTFEVDLCTGELRKQGKRLKLQDQPFHVLAVLLQRPGEVVTREELRSQIWPEDTFVDFDNSLNTAINKLREALGDSADSPRFIETLPRRGYRFLAAVTRNGLRDHFTNAVGRKPVLPAVALLCLTAAGAGGWFWHSRHSRLLTEKDTIVLADFTNTTGDPVFDDALKQGLRVQLEQSPFINILSDQKVAEGLRLMARSPDQKLTPALARDLCQRLGSKAILVGSISGLGKHYVIGLNALDCHTGDEVSSEQVEAESREHVLGALGDAATRMRRKLGESLASTQRYDRPLDSVTTSSLEALEAYGLGRKAWRLQGSDAALPFFQRAVELDPSFAMAYGRMGTVYANAGEVALMEENISKAYSLRSRVSERERLYIETHYHDLVTGDWEREAAIYELWRQTFPQDLAPQHNLTGLYRVLGQYDRALKVGLEELPNEPTNEDIYHEVALDYISLNRFDEAGTLLNKAAQLGLDSADLTDDRYLLAFLRRDAASMERLAVSARERQSAEDRTLFCAASAAAYFGRWREARKLFRQSASAAKQAGSTSKAAIHEADAAVMEAVATYPPAIVDAVAAMRLARNHYTEGHAATVFAYLGEDAQAKKLIADLKNNASTSVQRILLPVIDAAVALSHKRPEEAIEALRSTGTYDLSMGSYAEPIYLRGQAYLMLHKGGEAASEFQLIIEHPGIIGLDPVGALARLGLGRAHAMQGDTAKARAAYQDFLTVWKDADPDIPLLQQAKAEFAKLQ